MYKEKTVRGRKAGRRKSGSGAEPYQGDPPKGFKKLWKDLNESGEFHRVVSDYTYDWEYWRSPTGVFIFVSPSCKRITGRDCGEFLEDHRLLENIAHPEDRAGVKEHIRSELKSDRASSLTFRIIDRKGKIRWMDHRCRPVYDRRGKHIGRRASNRDITEFLDADGTLRDSDKIYRQIVEGLNDGIWAIDENSFTTFVNSRMANMLGYTIDEMTGKHLFSFMDEEAVRDCRQKLGRLRRGIKEQYGFEFLRKDGTRTYAIMEASPLYDEDNNYAGAIAVVPDMTDRKNMEEALQESEERYRELFNNMKSGVAVYEAVDDGNDFVFKDFNKGGERIEKLSRGDLIGKSLFKAFPSAKEFGLFNVMQRVWRTGKPEYIPAALYKDQRIEGWRENYVYKLPSGEVVAVYEDITEEKKAEEIIRNERRRLINILSSIQDGVYIINKQYDIEYINPVLKKEFGRLTGRKCYEYFHDRDSACPWCKNMEVLSGNIVRWEWYYPKNKKTYELIATPIMNMDGSISKLEIFRDITERKQAEEVLKRHKDTFEKLVDERSKELILAQNKLEQSKRLSDIGTLAATVAHELRNPLGVIQTAIYNVKRKRKSPSIDRHIVNIEKKILECSQIINNLLSYTRIKMPDYGKIRIYNVLNECIRTTMNKFYKRNYIIKCGFDSLKEIVIDNDYYQLKEIFNNILDNAYQSISVEKGKIEIKGYLDGEGFITILFRDNGTGIAKEDMVHVFEPFYTKKSKGTGLGLTICNELVHLHGGDINIESDEGMGTTVAVTLPINREMK